MGFLQALQNLGQLESKKNSDGEEWENFLEAPMAIQAKEEKQGQVIRVWLEVEEPNAECLRILSICHMDIVEYAKDEKQLKAMKKQLLYREPVGKNVKWGFAPVYKLGLGTTSGVNQLLGDGWQTDKNSRFFKLQQRVLQEYEKVGTFSAGSTDLVMQELVAKSSELAEKWWDKNRSYLLVFGIGEKGRFFYPAEVPALKKYFLDKLEGSMGGTGTNLATTGQQTCVLCCQQEASLTLDKLFPFSTFDKSGFLPGTVRNSQSEFKVFPICSSCSGKLSVGKETVDLNFTNTKLVPGLRVTVIPEFIGEDRLLGRAAEKYQAFIQNGVKLEEEKMFQNLARKGQGVVCHFLLWEINQAQQIIHQLIEEVPPSRLRKIECCWEETALHLLGWESTSLDAGLKLVYSVLIGLAGLRKEEQKALRDKIIKLYGRMLNNEKLDTGMWKQLMVAHLPGILHGAEGNMEETRRQVQGMAAVIDFMERLNKKKEDEI